jgi:uncharacterized protein YjbI with pentapeptide repeats
VRVLNQTPFPFAPLAGRVNFPGHSLTLIVKGTCDLAPDKKAVPAEEQPFPTGDEFHPGDEEQSGSCRYESDFAYLKPRADLLLIGKCHVPNKAPAQACKISFRVGRNEKTLFVAGNRNWEGVLGRTVSAPEPFREMPLSYEYSFGGPGYKKNPVGKGFARIEDESGKTLRPLPNIEDPQALIESPSDRPSPAGFGPLSKKWEPRQSCLGTYKGKWLKERWPWFPQDFDWAYFNAAPADMQVDGYLAGNEELYFENLHPKHSQYRSVLPGLRIRCFLNKAEPEKPALFEEVKMNLDTLWVDMESEKLVLVWRGIAPVHSEEFAEVKDAFVVSEAFDTEPLSLAHYQTVFQEAVATLEADIVAEEPPQPAAATAASAAAAPKGVKADTVSAVPEAEASSQAELGAIFKARGIDPSAFPQLAAQGAADQERLKKELQALDEGGFDAFLAKTTANLSAAFKARGIDLNNPPPLNDHAKQQLGRALKDLGMGDETSVEAAYAQGLAALRDACVELGLAQKTAAPLPGEEAKGVAGASPGVNGSAKEKPPLSAGEQARERLKEPLAGADLSGLDFSGLDLKGADFSTAILTGALFRSTNLSGANLSGVSASGADFTGAKIKGSKLVDGDFAKACFNGANLSGAQLSEASFHGATLEKALLDEVNGKGAVFAEANLAGASLQKAKFDQADFSQARLSRANLARASFKAASFEGASGPRANFSDADLTEVRAALGCDFSDASFRHAVGHGSTWKNGKLARADFSFAQMESADFASCMMDGANLYAADMKSTRFARASLRGAKMVDMNLFEGSLEKADVSEADLSGSNMYGVEFLETKFVRTMMRDTNLKMTKMAER